MAAHAKSRSKVAAFTNWIAAIVSAIMVFGIGCVAGYQAQDSFGAAPFYLIFGGNTDPGDGNGNGLARDQLVAGGWTTYENSYQIQWKADIGQGTATITDQAMPNAHAAFKRFCGHGCVVAGFSLGTSPALQTQAEIGFDPSLLYLFGGPQPSTGIWHSPYTDNPFIEPWLQTFGNFKTNRLVPSGTQVFYDTRDPYANSAPQCGGPGLFLLTLDGHYIVSRNAAFGGHIWTGSDGAIMHEVNYQGGPSGLPRSGSDPQQPWDFCPPNFPSFGVPAMNGDPGVPFLPGVPTR
jgi:hypothetical protein